ncbi:MAG: SIR2 family protein [Actinobacteria bacterium]|jgi:hypothetical protein|nr:SIR2 family protein [Actinomycetota bacterium]
MESVPWHAAIVPTDGFFEVEQHWSAVLGTPAARLRPLTWGDQPFAQANGRDNIYFFDVTAGDGLIDLLANLRRLLERIESDLRQRGEREKVATWRVAMPVLGIGMGGHRTSSGKVVEGLLTTSRDFTAESRDCDVVIVCARRSAYAAFQTRRRDEVGAWPSDLNLAAAHRLGALAQEGALALLLGAGVSIPAGLPSWGELIEGVRQDFVGANDVSFDDFGALGILDQAELLQRSLGPRLSKAVADRISKMEKPALSHVMLATLGCREVITTNYDHGFEKAVDAQAQRGISRLPWDVPEAGRPWILKLHGDVAKPETIVLTRGQFVQYDADWRPAGSLFQSVLLTKHLLVVGVSFTDDNILRLTHEAKRFRKLSGVKGPFGTVLSMRPEPLRQLLWEDELTWIGVGGAMPLEQARNIEIFLDALGAFAWSDASYLLDPDFRDMLTEPQRAMASELEGLARRMQEFGEDHGGSWQQLVESIRSFGARTN